MELNSTSRDVGSTICHMITGEGWWGGEFYQETALSHHITSDRDQNERGGQDGQNSGKCGKMSCF